MTTIYGCLHTSWCLVSTTYTPTSTSPDRSPAISILSEMARAPFFAKENTLRSLLPIIAIAAIVLFFVMVAAGPGTRTGNAWNYLTNGPAPINNGNSAHAEGSSIVGGPSLSAAKVDQILCSANSPACGTGNAFTLDSAEYNIDDAFALAVMKHESNYGTAGVARQTLSLGNLRCIPDAACVGGFAAFSSWQQGYSAFYKLISGPLYVGAGLTTPEQILAKYAPVADNNDPSGYAADVEASMRDWRAA